MNTNIKIHEYSKTHEANKMADLESTEMKTNQKQRAKPTKQPVKS